MKKKKNKDERKRIDQILPQAFSGKAANFEKCLKIFDDASSSF